MRFSAALSLAAVPAFVSAANIAVAVGQNGLTFTPSSAVGNPGDILMFTFAGGNHSVAQSTFANPCTKSTAAGAIDLGFHPVTGGAQPDTISVTVNATSPLWFYCGQTNPISHCRSGMVFAVNPTTDQTFNAFQQAAVSGTSPSSGASSSAASASTDSSAASASGAAPSGTSTGPAGATPSSTAPAAPVSTGNSTSSGAAPTSSKASGAMRSSDSAFAGLLTLLGLVAGLTF